jgi:aminopeptidase N
MWRVLNLFVYQKGGWTLHMLRNVIGTETFWTGIRDYYRRYQNQNASTDDLRRVMEQVSGKELGWFFSQWLTRSGVPRLTGSWRYDAATKQVEVELTQAQPGEPYRLPLELGLLLPGASSMRIERVELTGAQGKFSLAAGAEPSEVVIDPNTWMLMEPVMFVKK